MNKPLVSIITVVYNDQKGITATMNSVFNQTYPAIEYIVIDGGSTDGTKEMIEAYPSGVSMFISEPDHGIYEAMNKGIGLATGEIIGIINSGDHFETDAVESIVEAMANDPLADVYHGMLRVFTESRQFMQVIGNDSSFLTIGMIEHPTCFVKKEAYRKFGTFSLEYRSSSDYDFMLRLFEKKAKFHFIEIILANFYAGGISSKPIALIETIKIKYQHGLISVMRKNLFISFTKLRFALKK